MDVVVIISYFNNRERIYWELSLDYGMKDPTMWSIFLGFNAAAFLVRVGGPMIIHSIKEHLQ